MNAIALLNLAAYNHLCKSEEEYCFVRITPRPLRHPPPPHAEDDGGVRKEKKKTTT